MNDETATGTWCQTGDLRWLDGTLQQRYVFRLYGMHENPIDDEEWRDIPTVSAGASDGDR